MFGRIGSIISKFFTKLIRFIVRVIASTIKFSILALIAIYVLQILLLAFSLNIDNFLNNHKLYNEQDAANYFAQALPIGTPIEEIITFAEEDILSFGEGTRCSFLEETDRNPWDSEPISQLKAQDTGQFSGSISCSIQVPGPSFYSVYMLPSYFEYTIWEIITGGSDFVVGFHIQNGTVTGMYTMVLVQYL